MAETTGKAPFTYNGETYYTWYKIVGDLHSGIRPLVTLHGGPGMSHHYMLPHTYLATSHSIPVIFYDQLGIGASTHLRDKPVEFWSLELFMDELDSLLRYLGIQHDFDLLGNSWGGMFAGHYGAYRHPEGMKHLVIANAGPSNALWDEGTNKLLDKLPKDVRETIRRHERAGTVHTQEYQDAMEVFNFKHRCVVKPWPKELLQSYATLEEDPTVSTAMLGVCDFITTGTLKSWSIIDQLHNITSPTLLINAPNDTAQDATVLPFFQRVPKIKWVRLAESTHLPMFEEKERYFAVVGDFLTTV